MLLDSSANTLLRMTMEKCATMTLSSIAEYSVQTNSSSLPTPMMALSLKFQEFQIWHPNPLREVRCKMAPCVDSDLIRLLFDVRDALQKEPLISSRNAIFDEWPI